MPKPIAVKDGMCFAFPDILDTTIPSVGTVPIPYPNIAQLSDADGASDNVKAGGIEVILEDSEISSSTGGEASDSGGTGACTFDAASSSVKANGKGIVRQFDATKQDDDNATGMVMQGNATVLVGD